MYPSKINLVELFIILFLILVATSCNQNGQLETTTKLENISSADECHICGMNISQFPGPKGQALVHRKNSPLKFCSTTELISWLLQPDTKSTLLSAYVHDMGHANSWNFPNDQYFVNAEQAWYVIGHNKKGAMGASLASFTKKQDAELFLEKAGGKLLRFNDITLQMLTSHSEK